MYFRLWLRLCRRVALALPLVVLAIVCVEYFGRR